MVGLIGHVHLHQHVAGEELALGVHLAAAAHLGDALLRHEDVLEELGQAALGRALTDGLGHLVLEVRIGVNDVPLLRHGGLPSAAERQERLHAQRMRESATKKKIAETTMKITTISEEMPTSLRVGQVTLLASWRTCCMNSTGLVLAMA